MITIKATNIDQLAKRIKAIGKDIEQKVQLEMNAFADDVATDAKNLVASNSSDEGNLLRSIHPIYMDLSVAVAASATYAAYIEFGTRKFAAAHVASLPKTWQELASKSKGSAGGNFRDLLMAITAWCKRKGIDEKAAYPIARKIVIDGIRARPFLYPSFDRNYPLLIKRLQKILK